MNLRQRWLSSFIDLTYIILGLLPRRRDWRWYATLNHWYYRSQAASYDERVMGSCSYSEALESGLQRLSVVPKKILDVNTGTGFVALKLHTLFPNASIVATDLSESMLAQARRKAQKAHAPIQFERADVASLPWADESFDLITLHNGPPHIAEMMRLLRPGGQMLIAFSAGAGVARFIRASLERELQRFGALQSQETERGWWLLATRTSRAA